MKKLESRQDIETLVNLFYSKVRKDDVIGFFFNEVAKTDWNNHLPKMYAFWETLLFGKPIYKGNPMAVHFPVNAKVPLEKHHFAHWVKPVSYTHLDVYKRQVFTSAGCALTSSVSAAFFCSTLLAAVSTSAFASVVASTFVSTFAFSAFLASFSVLCALTNTCLLYTSRCV